MKLKSVLKSTVLVFFYSVLGFIFAYLFRTILARNATVAEYGLFYALYALFTTFMIFTDLGLGQSILRTIVNLNVNNQKQKIKSLLVYILFFQVVLSLIIFLIVMLFSRSLLAAMHTTNVVPLILIGLWFITLPIPVFLVSIFSGFQKPQFSGLIDPTRHILAVIIMSMLLFFYHNPYAPFIAYACINILMLLIYFPFVLKVFPDFINLKLRFNLKILKEVFIYGLYIALIGVINIVMTQTDTLMLTFYKGLEVVGLYQTAIPLAALIPFFTLSIITVAYPMITDLYTRKKFIQLQFGINLIYKYVAILSVPIAIVLFSYPETIIQLIFGGAYVSAASTLKILVVFGLFSMIIGINAAILLAIGKPKELSKIMIFAAITNVIINAILIPRYSMNGAAIATCISAGIAMVLSSFKIQKNIHVNLPWVSWIGSLIIGVLTIIVINYLKTTIIMSNLWLTAGVIGCVAGLFYLISLLLSRIVSFSEVKYFVEMIIKK